MPVKIMAAGLASRDRLSLARTGRDWVSLTPT
jgi:hypothetical protein